jgi:acetyl-CoA C-acetyltransferase
MVYIISAKRTAIGSFQGQFAKFSATDLGGFAIKSAVQFANCNVDEVFMGCVLQGGLGQAPARQAAIKAGLSNSIPTTTINKVCGSGMRAVMFASDSIRLNHIKVAVAGGMESMTNAPYFFEKARSGYRFGHGAINDLMLHDGLEDAFNKNANGTRVAMGNFADQTAKKFGFSREDQEQFAKETFEKALNAQKNNAFADQIVSIAVADKKSEITIKDDEQISRVKLEKFSLLKPAFSADGTVTAATSSAIADGAAAIVLSASSDNALGKIVGYNSFAQSPEEFTIAPIGAIKNLLAQLNWTVDSVDAFEINEAFAVVPMAVMKELNIPRNKVNISGGACALGHPIGTSGARIIVTLLHVMRAMNLKRGIAAACIGGGEATAIAIETC